MTSRTKETAMQVRSPQNRLKNWNGTVHYATMYGEVACGHIQTHASWLAPTVEDVTCSRCISQYGEGEQTGQTDAPMVNEHVAKRAAERAARRAAREAT
jgi:hypothetical protein